MTIKCLFLIENLQNDVKCKTGCTVNQKQITHISRHTLLFLWACFTIHSLYCLSFWKPVIILLIQRNMWMAVQQAMKIRTKLNISAALWIRLPQISAWRILTRGSSRNTHTKPYIRERKGKTCHSSSWFKMVLPKKWSAAILFLSGSDNFSESKEMG